MNAKQVNNLQANTEPSRAERPEGVETKAETAVRSIMPTSALLPGFSCLAWDEDIVHAFGKPKESHVVTFMANEILRSAIA